MEDAQLAIGQLARASGLSISALRFYDKAGLLPAASVDRHSGYRWYVPEQVPTARVIAQLRRVGMSLKEIRLVLASQHDSVALDAVIRDYVRRLEDGLDDARRVLSTIRHLLDDQEITMPITHVTMPGTQLAAAARAVRHAVGTNPEYPMLTGVLLDVDAAAAMLTLVATDRHRLAVADVSDCDVRGESLSVIAPVDLINDLIEFAETRGSVTLHLSAHEITVETSSSSAKFVALDHEFPEYRRLLRTECSHQIPIHGDALRHAISAAPTRVVDDVRLVSLGVTQAGAIAIGDVDADFEIALNEEFLLQATAAITGDNLVLELDGPIAPLAIRGASGAMAMIMPVRVD